MKRVQSALAVFSLLAATCPSAADAAIFSERHAFYLATGARIVDNFENSNYQHVMSDAAMGAVLGETEYFTYGGNVVDYNNIMPGFGVGGSRGYCSLCYGSFRLSFENTSLTNSGGVYGIGIDITENGGVILPYKYAALVAFVGGSIEAFELPYVAEVYPSPPHYQFWAITAETGIRSVDFISHSSSGPDRTFLIIDNLTIATAPVPEGSTFGLMFAGLFAVGFVAKGKRSKGKNNCVAA